MNTKISKWEKSFGHVLIEQIGRFEYFSGRLLEISSGFFLGRGHFTSLYCIQVNSYEFKWDFLNTFEIGNIDSNGIHIFS